MIYPTDPRAIILPNPAWGTPGGTPTLVSNLSVNGGYPLVGVVPVQFTTDNPGAHAVTVVVVDGQVVYVAEGAAPQDFLWDTSALSPGTRSVAVYAGAVDAAATGRWAGQAVLPSPVAGPLAANFDGTVWLEAATSGALSPNQPMTFAAWVYLSSVAANQWIAGKGNWSGLYEWILHFDTSLGFRCAIDVTGGGQQSAWTGTTPVINTWYHVAFVLAGNNLTVYQNGVPGGINTGCSGAFTHDNAYDLTLGRSLDGLAGLSGRIDEPGLWSAAKSVSSLYNGGAAKRFATLAAADLTNLVAFCDMSTGAFADASGNGHAFAQHGTVTLATGVA